MTPETCPNCGQSDRIIPYLATTWRGCNHCAHQWDARTVGLKPLTEVRMSKYQVGAR